MLKRLYAIIFVLLSISNIVMFSSYTKSISANSSQKTGYATIKVIESNTLAPINNATICIIETREYFQTDKYGYTQKISLPIIPNTNFDISLKRNWGDFTILAYKSGYSSFISYYNKVYDGITSVGIICTLSPIINPSDPLVISSANKPPDDYSSTLVKLYKK